MYMARLEENVKEIHEMLDNALLAVHEKRFEDATNCFKEIEKKVDEL
jgi:hypothetical protein